MKDCGCCYTGKVFSRGLTKPPEVLKAIFIFESKLE
jgi:hypothetical protein